MEQIPFASLFSWLSDNSLGLIFAAMVIEGPATTTAAAFAAALGYFHLSVIFGLSILADLLADAVYYFIGHAGRTNILERFGSRFRLTKEQLGRLDQLLHAHIGKAILFIKMTPFLATPGLMLAGAAKVPLRRYALYSGIITVPRALFFVLTGYSLAAASSRLAEYLHYGKYAAFTGIVLVVFLPPLYRKLSGLISKKLGKL